jgi:hypothetical protein
MTNSLEPYVCTCPDPDLALCDPPFDGSECSGCVYGMRQLDLLQLDGWEVVQL